MFEGGRERGRERERMRNGGGVGREILSLQVKVLSLKEIKFFA